jgi:hypothetical protein
MSYALICHFCPLCGALGSVRNLVYFAKRYYCHPACGFEKWGAEFLRKLSLHGLKQVETEARRRGFAVAWEEASCR